MADKDTEKVEAPEPFKATERKSLTKPVVAPDGHVNLSQEDIDKRDA